MVDEVPGGDHAGFVPRVDGNASGDAPFLQQLPKSPITVPAVSGHGHRMEEQLPDQPGDRFGLLFPCVDYVSGQDETAAVYNDVLLVLQPGGPADVPAGVGVNRVQPYPALGDLEVPRRFLLNIFLVNGGLRDQNKPFSSMACSLNPSTVMPLGANP